MAQEKATKAERAEEERQRQQQVLLEQQERDRQKLLEETKREHAEAEKRLKLEKEKLAQLQDLQKQPKPVRPPAQAVPESDQAKTGTNGKDDSLEAQYVAAIQNAAINNWLRPETTQSVVCDVDIKQIPGGDLLDVHVVNPCNADPATRNTVEQAIKRAAPLPYKGYETVFRREVIFTFCYPREVCPK
jgi:colicin import membrane protein